MCATRWVQRHDSINVLVELFRSILPSLIDISTWYDREAASQATILLSAISKPEFLLALLTINKVFAITKTLSEYLQSINLDLKKGMNYADKVLELLKDLQENSVTTFNEIFVKAKEFLNYMGEDDEIKIPRISQHRSIYRSNIPASSAEEYFRRTIFLPFIENMIIQIIDRLQKLNNLLSKFSCLMIPNFDECKVDYLQLIKFYSSEENLLGDSEDVNLAELQFWKKCIKNEILQSALDYYTFCDKDLFPRIKLLLKILCTLPITTCTSERSFSTLRRLKTYLRNTMSNDRLNGLAHLNISKVNLSPDEIMDELAKKPRRLDFCI